MLLPLQVDASAQADGTLTDKAARFANNMDCGLRANAFRKDFLDEASYLRSDCLERIFLLHHVPVLVARPWLAEAATDVK